MAFSRFLRWRRFLRFWRQFFISAPMPLCSSHTLTSAPQKHDIHAEEQPEHQNDQGGQAAVNGEVGELLYKQGEKVGEQHPPRGGKGRPCQVAQEGGAALGHPGVQQGEKAQQQHKPRQGFEPQQEGCEQGRGLFQQEAVQGAAQHHQGRRHNQRRRKDNDAQHRHGPQAQIAPGLFGAVDLVQALDDRHHAHGRGPHRGDHRHGQHPGGLQRAGEKGLQIGGHAFREGLQGRLDKGDAVGKVDALHQRQQKGHKGKKRDQQEKGAVGRGGVQAVPVHPV